MPTRPEPSRAGSGGANDVVPTCAVVGWVALGGVPGLLF